MFLHSEFSLTSRLVYKSHLVSSRSVGPNLRWKPLVLQTIVLAGIAKLLKQRKHKRQALNASFKPLPRLFRSDGGNYRYK